MSVFDGIIFFDTSRLMEYAQQIEESKLKETNKDGQEA